MDPERWQQIKEIFQRAVELPKEERIRFIEGECGEDAALREEVVSLLETELEGTEFLEIPDRPASRPSGSASGLPTLETPERYRIAQKVGEGGMGEVYEAEQLLPVRRRVAIKVIKRGMDTREVIARFETERQALALMSHRSIAKVFDAGATAQGRPYFAMEFVDGIPITDYCDRNRLDPQARIRLFQEVCAAVQHAHQKGIIHRDLKPSNILVKIEGGDSIPKIIDFGVSKAIAQRLTEKTLFTQLGQWVGTPEYMSPEQADPVGLDIDTRSDVYSLGVVLYELLVGAKPFDPESLRKAGFDEVRRVIREEDPPRPSTRLSSLGDASTAAARNRRVDRDTLHRELRGDLDAITMKALDKDRTLRYGTPIDLADDLGRYLDHQPVLAGPPTAAYRMRKFVRRHKLAVSAASAVLLAILAGSSVALWQAAEARRERARADRRFTDVRELANSFIFEVYDAIVELPGATPVRELVVERALEYLDSLAEESAEDRLLQKELAAAYVRIGDVQGAPFHANLGDYSGARASYAKALGILGGLSRESPDRDLDRQLARAHVRLGRMFQTDGRTETALDHFQQAREATRQALELDSNDLDLLSDLSQINESVASIHEIEADHESALEAYRDNLKIDQAIWDARPEAVDAARTVAITRGRTAAALEGLGDPAGAAEQLRLAIGIFDSILAEDEFQAGVARERAVLRRELGKQLGALGDQEAAARAFDVAEGEMTHLRTLDPADQILIGDLGVLMHVKGRLAAQQGRHDEALVHYESAFETARSFVPEVLESVEVQTYLLTIHLHRGEALAELGRKQAALDSFRKAVGIGETALAGDEARVLGSSDLAIAYARLGSGLLESPEPGRRSCNEAASALARSATIRASLMAVDSPVGWPDPAAFEELEQLANGCL